MSLGGGGGGTPPPTEEERALAERGAREFNDFLERGVPLARRFAEMIDDPARAERYAGRTSAAVASAFADDLRDSITTGLATGAGMGSSGIVLSAAMPALKMAGATGVAQSRARQAADDLKLQGLMKISAFGRGLSDDSSLGLRQAAQDATRAAIAEADAKTREYVSALDAIGTLGGYVGGKAISEMEAERWYKMAKETPKGQPIRPPTPTLDFFRRF